jgi:hypothetical protein
MKIIFLVLFIINICFSQATLILDNIQIHLKHNTDFILSAVGDSVSYWIDQSRNGNDGSADNVARKPIYDNGAIVVTETNDAGFTWGSWILNGATSWGISFWFKNYSGTGSDFVVGGAATGNIYFRGNADSVGFRDTGSNYNNSTITKTSIDNESTWKHIVITSGGNDVCFYLDGTLQDQFDPTGTTALNFDAWPQGYNIQTTNSLNGTFTEFVCTSDSISPSEIVRLYQLGYDGIPTEPGFQGFLEYKDFR